MHLKFGSDEDVKFPLYLRIPAWANNVELFINGQKQSVKAVPSKFIKIERTWNNNDEVKLVLPMKVSLTEWKQNKNSASVNYGPLTFSLLIKENYVKAESDKTAIGDSKWQKGADTKLWPSYEIHAMSDWNYGLYISSFTNTSNFKIVQKDWPKNNFPFTIDAVPIQIIAKGKQILDWKIDQSGLAGRLMQSPVTTDQPLKEIALIPMGAARLRVAQFPVVK